MSEIITSFCILCLIILILFLIIIHLQSIKKIKKELNSISERIKLIAHGNLNSEIKCEGEFTENLCKSLNELIGKISSDEKLKNDFISSMAHELKTPLTAIRGWAETILADEQNIDLNILKRGINVILSESERLYTIVEEILDYSKLKNSKISVKLVKIDVLAELSEVVCIFKEKAKLEKKVLAYDEYDGVYLILGDKNRIRQVFMNVLDNALKYTNENQGVSVSANKQGSNVVISISDNGIGIPKDDLPNVTKKFYKANKNHPGSGIGLAIVSEIVELHGGNINILSEEGIGTTVSISFPILE